MIIEIIDETEVVPESHQELVHSVVSFAANYLKSLKTKNAVFHLFLANVFVKSTVSLEILIK